MIKNRLLLHGIKFIRLSSDSNLPQKFVQVSEDSRTTSHLPSRIAQKVKMYRTITPDKWEQVHKSAPLYTIYITNQSEIDLYSRQLLLSRISLGTSVSIGFLTVSGLAFLAVNAYVAYVVSMFAIACTSMNYTSLKRMRADLLLKVTYDTQKRMFCFVTLGEKQTLKEDWLYPSEIGINLSEKKGKFWIYYNKTTMRKYATIGKGKWVNEEIFIYSLMRSGSCETFRGQLIDSEHKKLVY